MKKLSLFILLLLFWGNAVAQNLSNQKFWYITPDQGLSQSTVESIYQDSYGFMWFGTLEGLNKFEGQSRNIVVYKHDAASPNSLSSDEVEIIYEDSNQDLWIGTDAGGLNLYNRDTDNFTVFTAAETPHTGRLSDNTVQTILEDSKGNFWLGTYKGLNLMDRKKGTFKQFYSDPDNPNTLSSSFINDIYEDREGNIWIGTYSGLNLMNTGSETFQRFYESADNYSSNYIEVVHEDSKDRLWIGTQGGLFIFDREEEVFVSATAVFKDDLVGSISVLSIIEDSQGVLWVGTENDGLFALDVKSGELNHFRYSAEELYGINNNSIYSLYESRDNILWIGTFDGGLNIINRNRNKFEHFSNNPGNENSLNENSIFTFLKTEKGDFWIGTDGGGLNKFNEENETFTAIRHNPNNKNSLPNDVTLDMIEDKNNRIWIGTYRGGLTRFDVEENTFKTYKFDSDNPASLSHNQVFTVYEDSEGYIWAGTNGGGVNKLIDEEKGIFKRFNPDPGSSYLPQRFIRDIYEDENGEFWLGTYGGGVVRFNESDSSNSAYNIHNDKMGSSVALYIYQDTKGTIWAGTKGGGVAYYNKELDRFESYTTNDGLPNDIVNGILEDEKGNLWLSTNNGLSRFNRETKEFKNFNLNDGVQSREFKAGAAYKTDDGYMYFGGINGYNKFHPDSIKENSEVSPIALTDIQVFNKTLPIGGDSPLKKHISQVQQIELPHTSSVITFKYSALNFNPDQGYRYAYKLEGFDVDWNHVNFQNTATYTNLDPGNYTFKVKAANNDGIWGNENTQVQLIITPPFWQTIWFYLLCLLVVIGLIFGGYKYRLRNITKLNKRLERDVAKRTSELEESNRDLKRALHDLEVTRGELAEKAHKAGMADIATGVLHNIGNVLNSVTTSTSISEDVLKKSKLKKLFKANELLRDNINDLENFLTKDPQGKKLADYYLKLDEALKAEYKSLYDHNQRLGQKVQLINDVISAQQSYASVGINNEKVNLEVVLDDTLTIHSNSMERHAITIKKEIEPTEPVPVQKTKLVHVILNILNNAKDAMAEVDNEENVIWIKLYQKGKEVFLEIKDNGAGIKEDHLNKIFNHGFTTKKTGHGFGLHSSANYVTEMNGNIEVKSEGLNKGATFILSFPVDVKYTPTNGEKNMLVSATSR